MRDCSRSADTRSVSVGRGGCATVSSCSLARSLIADHVVRIRSCASTKIRGIVKGLSFCCSLARVRVLAPSRETFIVARCPPSSPAAPRRGVHDRLEVFADRPFNPCYIGRSSTTGLRPRSGTPVNVSVIAVISFFGFSSFFREEEGGVQPRVWAFLIPFSTRSGFPWSVGLIWIDYWQELNKICDLAIWKLEGFIITRFL